MSSFWCVYYFLLLPSLFILLPCLFIHCLMSVKVFHSGFACLGFCFIHFFLSCCHTLCLHFHVEILITFSFSHSLIETSVTWFKLSLKGCCCVADEQMSLVYVDISIKLLMSWWLRYSCLIKRSRWENKCEKVVISFKTCVIFLIYLILLNNFVPH